jgi:hypothetical protein
VGVVPAIALAALIEGFITPSGISHAVTITLGVVVAAAYILVVFLPPAAGGARSWPGEVRRVRRAWRG